MATRLATPARARFVPKVFRSEWKSLLRPWESWMSARVSDLIGRSVDLIDLDVNTPFTRHLRTENELVRAG